MGPTSSVPAGVGRAESPTSRPVVLVVDPQRWLPNDVLAGLLDRSSGPLDPHWPVRTSPEVRAVRQRDEARRAFETEPVVAAVLVLPEGDQQAHERTRDLRAAVTGVPLVVVHDGGPDERAELVARGADDAVTRDRLATDLVPALVTELRRRRRTTLEALMAAHLLVDVLAWESGYVLLDPDGYVVESALQSGEPWFGGLTGLRAADLVAAGDLERFEGARRLAQQVPSVARTVVVEVVPPGSDRRWLEITLVNVTSVSPLDGVVATHRDVSDQRQGMPPAGPEPAVAVGAEDEVLMECLPEGVVVFGPDGRVTAWNASATRLLGIASADALGRDIQEVVPHVRPPTHPAAAGRPEVWVDEMRSVLADGSEEILERRFTRRTGSDGAEAGTVLVVTAVTAARAAAALARRFQAILDSTSEAVLSKTSDGTIITWNDAASRMYGYTAEEAVGQHVSILVPAGRRAELATIMHRVVAGAAVERLETVRLRKDRTEARVILNVSPLYDDEGNVAGAITVASDVTEQRAAEAERAIAEVRFDGAFRRSAFGMAMADLLGRMTVVNPALSEMLGRTPRELVGHLLSDFGAGAAPAGAAGLPAVREGGDSYTDERRYTRPDGAVVWLQCNVTLIRGAAEEPLYLMVQVLDITARKRIELELEHRVLHDDLTGLPNRALLNDRLEQSLASARRSGGQVGVVFLDVDGFKHVNDALGHGTGDSLLVELGHRLCSTVRPDDTVARFGGDEFVILCTDVGIGEMEQLADRIRTTMAERFDVGGNDVEVHASLGITVSLPESSAQSMLSEADAAMFRAKDLGRNRAAVFDDTLRARAAEFLDGEKALRMAIARRDLVAYYQPIMDLASDRPIGVEALVRWVRDDGVVPPDQFIPLAEATGLVVRLGELVLLESAETVSGWSDHGWSADGLWVSVNLSARQLAEPSLVETVRHTLETTGLAPERLHLEVTETVVMDDVRESIVRLDEIRSLGVQLSIDDFGTGYSSLAYLKQLPVGTLKIDRSFVDGVVDDPDDRTIVEAVVSLGRALGLTCLAEGVETPGQLDALVRMGCQLGQGYLWARPMPAEEARTWLRDRLVPGRDNGGTMVAGDVTDS